MSRESFKELHEIVSKKFLDRLAWILSDRNAEFAWQINLAENVVLVDAFGKKWNEGIFFQHLFMHFFDADATVEKCLDRVD